LKNGRALLLGPPRRTIPLFFFPPPVFFPGFHAKNSVRCGERPLSFFLPLFSFGRASFPSRKGGRNLVPPPSPLLFRQFSPLLSVKVSLSPVRPKSHLLELCHFSFPLPPLFFFFFGNRLGAFPTPPFPFSQVDFFRWICLSPFLPREDETLSPFFLSFLLSKLSPKVFFNSMSTSFSSFPSPRRYQEITRRAPFFPPTPFPCSQAPKGKPSFRLFPWSAGKTILFFSFSSCERFFLCNLPYDSYSPLPFI